MPKAPAKVPATPAMTFAASLAALAKDQTPANLEILLRVQRELLADQAKEMFTTAFVRMRPGLPQIERNGRVLSKTGSLLYRYARYEDLDAVITPILDRFGFALSFLMRVEGNATIVVGRLMHEGGHVEISEYPLRPDRGQNRNELQAEGSGISYAKR